MNPDVAWVEITGANLYCPCGEVTVLLEACLDASGTLPGPLFGYPTQKCPKCGAAWFCPSAADCELVKPGKKKAAK